MTTTVYQDSSPTSIGPDATRDDLDVFCANLAAHLAEKFGIPVDVEQVLGGGRTPCPENDEIDEYVRDLNAGDGWIAFLPAA